MTVVLDASALLAALQDEPGAQRVEQHLRGALMSAVNWSEVAQKLATRGINAESALAALLSQGVTITPFTVEQANLTASLYAEGKPLGLSLADRACLALGQMHGLPVLTADREWRKLVPDFRVELIR